MSRWQYQVSSKPPFQPTPPLFPLAEDFSETVFTRAFQYDVTVNPGVPILPSFGYFQPFRDPVRRNPPPIITGEQPTFAAGFTPILPSFGYYRSFQDPVRRPPSMGLVNFNPFLFTPAEVITVDKWFSPFIDVIRPKPYKFTLPDQTYLAGLVLQNVLPVFTDFSEVTFTKQFQYQGLAFSFGATQEIITLDKWYQNFVPLPNLPFEVSDSSIDFIIQLPETITVDKWFQNLSIPQKLSKTLLQSSAQDFVAFTELIPPVTQDWFYYAFSEPVRFKPQLNTALQLAQEALTFFPGIDTFQDLRWYRALSEPVRYRWFPASEQQGFIGLTIPIYPTIGYADVIVQTWNVLAETDTWVINLDLTGCDCGD